MYVKKLAAGAAIVAGLGFSAVSLGAGIASATPPAPAVAGWQQEGHGHWGHGGDGGDWDNRGGWDNGGGYGNWGYGPGWGCVTGPFGHVTWCP